MALSDLFTDKLIGCPLIWYEDGHTLTGTVGKVIWENNLLELKIIEVFEQHKKDTTPFDDFSITINPSNAVAHIWGNQLQFTVMYTGNGIITIPQTMKRPRFMDSLEVGSGLFTET